MFAKISSGRRTLKQDDYFQLQGHLYINKANGNESLVSFSTTSAQIES